MAWEDRNKSQEDKPLDEMEPGAEAAAAPSSRRRRNVFRCPGCGTRTYGGMAHCADCGHELSRTCPCCEAQWRYEFSYSFCPGCGTQLQPRKKVEGQESARGEAPVSAGDGGES